MNAYLFQFFSIALTVCFVCVTAFFPGEARALEGASLALSPLEGAYQLGEQFSVNIVLDTKGNQVQGADISYIRYNPLLLEVADYDAATQGIQIAPGALMPNTLGNIVDARNGVITFSQLTGSGLPFIGSGVLATIHFRAIAAGMADVTFDFTLDSTIDSNVASQGIDILRSVGNGRYSIGSHQISSPPVSGLSAGSASSARDSIAPPVSAPASATPSLSSAPAISPPAIQTPVVPAPAFAPALTTESSPAPAPSPAFSSSRLPQGINEGDLVRGPDGIKVYIVNKYGWKRHIFNPAIFNMYGHFRWDKIRTVDQATLDALRTSDVYRAQGDARVFALFEIDEKKGLAQKRHIRMNADAFARNGWKWEQVFIINSKERDYYQEGTAINDGDAVAAASVSAPKKIGRVKREASKSAESKKPVSAAYAIRKAGDQRVYLLENNTKRWLQSTGALEQYLVDWNKITVIDQAAFDAYPEGPPVQ